MNLNSNRDSSFSNAVLPVIAFAILQSPIASAYSNNSGTTQFQIQRYNISPSKKPIDISIGRLRELSTYKDGWFEPHYKAASKQTIEDAELFLYNFHLSKAERPFITIANDGEINLLWKNNSFTLDLGFSGDGTYNYYGCSVDGMRFYGDDKAIDEQLSAVIMDLLRNKNDLTA